MLSLGHKKLIVWQQSIQFIVEIYKLTGKYPNHELYALISQTRRAAVSISSNIAEGASRSSVKDRKRFYEIARSSLVELDTQLEIAKQLEYCTENELKPIEAEMDQLFGRLSMLISKTK